MSLPSDFTGGLPVQRDSSRHAQSIIHVIVLYLSPRPEVLPGALEIIISIIKLNYRDATRLGHASGVVAHNR